MSKEEAVKNLVEVCEMLESKAWGYGHIFESSFHAEVYYLLSEALIPFKDKQND